MDDDDIPGTMGRSGGASPAPPSAAARTLVIRCWQEPAGDRATCLRGTVRDLGGHGHLAFQGYDALAFILRRTLGLGPERPGPTDHPFQGDQG